MIDTYPDNVNVGDVVRDSQTGEPYDVTDRDYQVGHGWRVFTRCVDGYSGPIFWPDMNRMPDPDPYAEA